MEKIVREDDVKIFRCNIKLDMGEICFETSGFEQIIRKNPIHAEGSWLEFENRGGISFDTTPYQ